MLQTKDKVYKLDTQVLAERWAGQKVKMTGTASADHEPICAVLWI